MAGTGNIAAAKYALGSTIPSYWPPSVHNSCYYEQEGPFSTKGGGQLLKTIEIPEAIHYLRAPAEELELIGRSIDGTLREYVVSGLPAGGEGGHEFHRIRKELLCVWDGEIDLYLTDVYGGKWLDSDVRPEDGYVYIPPFVLHAYVVKEDDTQIKVLANTAFDASDWRTHDTFSKDAFGVLQAHFMEEGEWQDLLATFTRGMDEEG